MPMQSALNLEYLSNCKDSGPTIQKNVDPHFSSISTPGDVQKGRGVIVFNNGHTHDICMPGRGRVEYVDLESDYNRARYIFKARDAAGLFDSDEIRRFDEHIGKGKLLSPVIGSMAISEKGTGRGIAATSPVGIPIWHTEYYRKVAKLAVSEGVPFDDALSYVIHHERRHHAVSARDLIDMVMHNETRLEKRLERDLYSYFTKMAEETEGTEREHYLNMAKIAASRHPKTRETYNRKNLEEEQDEEASDLEALVEEEQEQEEDGEAEESAEEGEAE